MPPRSYLPTRLPPYRPVMPKASHHNFRSLPRIASPPALPISLAPIASSQFAFLRLSFSTLPPRAYPSLSPLFALAQLSNARESQALSKKSRLSRIDHSPALEIIRSSEVEQLPFVTTSNSTRETRELRHEKEKAWREFKGGRETLSRRRDRGRAWGGEAVSEWGFGDATRAGAEAAAEAPVPMALVKRTSPTTSSNVQHSTAAPTTIARPPPRPQSRANAHVLAVGKAVLSAHAARHARLTRALAVGQRQHAREAEGWAAERRTFERERRSGSFIVLASALLATVALAWRWGETRSTKRDSNSQLEQWRKKWEMRETETARLTEATAGNAVSTNVGSGLLLAADETAKDMTKILYTCHEDGCGQRKFATDEDFMGHYRTTHPVLVEHLYGNADIKNSTKQMGWFWA